MISWTDSTDYSGPLATFSGLDVPVSITEAIVARAAGGGTVEIDRDGGECVHSRASPRAAVEVQWGDDGSRESISG